MISLIANSGIQFYSKKIVLDLTNARDRMSFRESFDTTAFRLRLELAHKFADEDIYVSKRDLSLAGFIDNGVVTLPWNEIQKQTSDILQYDESEIINVSASTLTRGQISFIDKLNGKWLPFPYFEYNTAGRLMVGPFNWSRMKLASTGNVIEGKQEYDLIIAFDTNTIYDDGNYSDDYKESPLFPNEFDKYKDFGVCNKDFDLMTFCSSESDKNSWIDKYILQLIHNTSDINNVIAEKRFTYLASYIYFLKLLYTQIELPIIRLFKDRNVEWTNVDLVVDLGNSKTTALLFDESNFTKVKMLALRDLSAPENEYTDSFDMQMAFQKANFGEIPFGNSKQFTYPSFIRLGEEAKYLMYNSTNALSGRERLAVCSSPKRYLWDQKKRKYEWENVQIDNEIEPIWIDGISEQLNADGTINLEGFGGGEAKYSRRSLMTFAFLEMLCQARMQTNSYDYRYSIGNEDSPRRINKIVITCPTAMSKVEQIALRQAAEEATILLDRYINNTYKEYESYKNLASKVKIVPSITSLKNKEERTEWTYDEATCSQFVYLSAEIAKRYKCNCTEFFELYGKKRSDLAGYDKHSLTIGSLDIGAGTTDLMICTYKYSSVGQTTLKPIPLFWESFYIAGDDLLKKLVEQIVIEGHFSMVSSTLNRIGKNEQRTQLIADFFGVDNNRMSFTDRLMRKDFNLQISMPIALTYLEEARKQTRTAVFSWKDIFYGKNMPSEKILDHFFNHFGFRIEEVEWHYEAENIEPIITNQFEDLLKKVAAAMAAYQCDIILLSGRPTSLKQIENLFLKYYPVSPNRLKTLTDYRVGRWYPFQDGNGYFQNQKSIVAVGALIGYIASTQGSFGGLSLDLSELKEKLIPTTDYFGVLNPLTREMKGDEIIVTPDLNSKDLSVPALPIVIGCRQLNTPSYPTRPFYTLSINEEAIEQSMKDRGYNDVNTLKQKVDAEKIKIQTTMPLVFRIVREDYQMDKEMLKIESVINKMQDEFPLKYFSLQVKSLDEAEDFWLDSGAFNLSITIK